MRGLSKMLRDYQQRAIDDLYKWFESGNKGNPCLDLPTGAGKSHIVAALCKDALQNWPETRVLMLTHVKELIEQNAEKMREHWKGAPMGIYSASVGQKVLDEPITFAGIQSIRNKAEEVGHIDLVIIDECHLVNHKNEGGYRQFIAKLKEINPNLRVIGLTATPFRLGHGLITDDPAIFDDIINPVTIEELIHKGFLAPLRSKITGTKLSTDGVHKRGGEYIEKELQAAVDNSSDNEKIVKEVIERAEDRKAWLFFCAGVDHAEHIKNELLRQGISAQCITGKNTKKQREEMLRDFKSGKITALTNANILTTGFDYPDIDLIAMLRPTMSPALYVQMAGRGLRPKSHTDHCLVLDFAGCVRQHGPITNVITPTKEGSGNGEAPVKACPNCFEIVHVACTECSHCGELFPEKEEKKKAPPKLNNDDIMGKAPSEMEVKDWRWLKHISKTSGKEMLAIRYYGGFSDPAITEYLAVTHSGYAGEKARTMLLALSAKTHTDIKGSSSLEEVAERMSDALPPSIVKYTKEGKFFKIISRGWEYA